MDRKNNKPTEAQGAEVVDMNKVTAEKNTKMPVMGLNLAETLKVVEDLYKKKRRRDALENTINKLDSFEITQKDELEPSGSYYNGCVFEIKDDSGKTFSTRNPVLIELAAEFLKATMQEKLTEIEAEITLPVA